jgi:hypothetical protein
MSDRTASNAGRVSLGDLVSEEDPLAQWKALYSLMVSTVPGLQGDESYAFQFANPEIGADWWAESGQDQRKFLADAKPIATGGFYSPGASLVSENYGLLLFSIENSTDQSLVRARADYNAAMDADQVAMGILGDLASDLDHWRLGEGNVFELKLTKDTRIDHTWHLGAGGRAGATGFVVSGQGEALDSQIMKSHYELTIRYTGMKAYSITRERKWWKGGLLSVYNSDLTKFISPYTRATFFDRDRGLLNVVPASVVVAYDVRLLLRVSREFFDEHRLDMEGAGQMNVGPYKLNGTIRHDNTDEQTDDDSVEISYRSTRRQPVVFGVFTERFTADD